MAPFALVHNRANPQFQYFRPQTIQVSGLFLQVFAFILGRGLEIVLPGPNHVTPRLRTRNNRFWRFVNPGPFSMSSSRLPLPTALTPHRVLDLKEHVAISIMSVSGDAPPH